jgi:F-type H+-transporting ATPase subunit gamma
MRLRIRSVKNIAQVTRALETVSASKVRKATAAVLATRPYAEKAWKVLVHLARQPGHASLHPLLKTPATVKRALVLVISSDRGLAGAYNVNVVRNALVRFSQQSYEVRYVTIGRKGRDMLLRRKQEVIAEFSNLPDLPSFADVSAIGRLAIDEFLTGDVDQVFLVYTEFVNMIVQQPVIKQMLPLQVEAKTRVKDFKEAEQPAESKAVFTYEPDQREILDTVLTRFTELQVYQAILSALASEHAARMVAMRNATDNAFELSSILQLEYNKARQQTITNDMLDIVGGAEALTKGY